MPGLRRQQTAGSNEGELLGSWLRRPTGYPYRLPLAVSHEGYLELTLRLRPPELIHDLHFVIHGLPVHGDNDVVFPQPRRLSRRPFKHLEDGYADHALFFRQRMHNAQISAPQVSEPDRSLGQLASPVERHMHSARAVPQRPESLLQRRRRFWPSSKLLIGAPNIAGRMRPRIRLEISAIVQADL